MTSWHNTDIHTNTVRTNFNHFSTLPQNLVLLWWILFEKYFFKLSNPISSVILEIKLGVRGSYAAEKVGTLKVKIENRGKKYFLWGKKSTSIPFSMKIKTMDLWMQIEGTKLIFINSLMNFSLLYFFQFAPRMPQIAQILVSTFKIFQGRVPPGPLRKFLFFFLQQFQALVVEFETKSDPSTSL